MNRARINYVEVDESQSPLSLSRVCWQQFLKCRQVREYVTTSLWGGFTGVVPLRRLSNLVPFVASQYADVLCFFQGGRPLPLALTIDDAPGDTAFNIWLRYVQFYRQRDT